MNIKKGYFITGTDTGIGKTRVTTLLTEELVAQGYKVAAIKPVASGFELINGQWINQDVATLTAASNVVLPQKRINRYAFKPAIAPHFAAQNEGQLIDFNRIKEDVIYCQQQAEWVLVEAVGGWSVPLNGRENSKLDKKVQPYQDVEDLAKLLHLPVIMVVGVRLGCINHAVLTQRAITTSGVNLAGWVANCCDPSVLMMQQNIECLQQRIDAPLLAKVPYLDSHNQDVPHNYFVSTVE